MAQVTLSVGMNVRRKLNPSKLSQAVKRVLEWSLRNDIEGAEVLEAGAIGETIHVAITGGWSALHPDFETMSEDGIRRYLAENATYVASDDLTDTMEELLETAEMVSDRKDEDLQDLMPAGTATVVSTSNDNPLVRPNRPRTSMTLTGVSAYGVDLAVMLAALLKRHGYVTEEPRDLEELLQAGDSALNPF